jgi:farnesyl-diphosphate farnesyltransferase
MTTRELTLQSLDHVLFETSRTFALGIQQLRAPLRREVALAYLVLRVSDCFEDSARLPTEKKLDLLSRWADLLAGDGDPASIQVDIDAYDAGEPDWLAVRHLPEILASVRALDPRTRDVITRHAGDSTAGMARWVERGPVFETEADLDDYMHEVAGRVGLLLTDLFSLHSDAIARKRETLRPLGRSFGLGLQTVNVIRGLHEDHRRGWTFIPRAAIPPDTVPMEAYGEREEVARSALDWLSRKAVGHLATDARTFTEAIPRSDHDIRVFCLLPLLFALRTLVHCAGRIEVFSREVKISRGEVRRLHALSGSLGRSNAWIRFHTGREARRIASSLATG